MSRLVVSAVLACACIQACASTPVLPAEARGAPRGAESPTVPSVASRESVSTDSGAAPPSATAPGPAPTTAPTSMTAPPQATPRSVRRDLALPFGWETVTTAAFEEALARWNPEGAVGRLDGDALAELGRALDGETPRALRAVLLLAHSSAPEARDALLARLERRIRPAADTFPAVDVATAAALARKPGVPPEGAESARAAALDELARGRRPHPLLVVRVECAAASVALGRPGATAFLLAVLREGTAALEPRPSWVRDATSIDDLAFAQWRASEALARAAGVANTYRPEFSAVERARIASEFERALAARPQSGGT